MAEGAGFGGAMVRLLEILLAAVPRFALNDWT